MADIVLGYRLRPESVTHKDRVAFYTEEIAQVAANAFKQLRKGSPRDFGLKRPSGENGERHATGGRAAGKQAG